MFIYLKNWLLEYIVKIIYKRFEISICVQLENKYQPNF